MQLGGGETSRWLPKVKGSCQRPQDIFLIDSRGSFPLKGNVTDSCGFGGQHGALSMPITGAGLQYRPWGYRAGVPDPPSKWVISRLQPSLGGGQDGQGAPQACSCAPAHPRSFLSVTAEVQCPSCGRPATALPASASHCLCPLLSKVSHPHTPGHSWGSSQTLTPLSMRPHGPMPRRQ